MMERARSGLSFGYPFGENVPRKSTHVALAVERRSFMSGFDRRRFLTAAAGAAACLATQGDAARGAQGAPPPPDEISLGRTGVKMSRVGLGTGMRGGNRQSDQTRLGFEKLVGLMRHAYDRGVTFFDLADLYGSHLFCREALRSISREDVAILT